jgi:hypothetical protein
VVRRGHASPLNSRTEMPMPGDGAIIFGTGSASSTCSPSSGRKASAVIRWVRLSP